jgi:hypothetical protein
MKIDELENGQIVECRMGRAGAILLLIAALQQIF